MLGGANVEAYSNIIGCKQSLRWNLLKLHPNWVTFVYPSYQVFPVDSVFGPTITVWLILALPPRQGFLSAFCGTVPNNCGCLRRS
jgi:hypothetical protein